MGCLWPPDEGGPWGRLAQLPNGGGWDQQAGHSAAFLLARAQCTHTPASPGKGPSRTMCSSGVWKVCQRLTGRERQSLRRARNLTFLCAAPEGLLSSSAPRREPVWVTRPQKSANRQAGAQVWAGRVSQRVRRPGLQSRAPASQAEAGCSGPIPQEGKSHRRKMV